MAKIRYIQSYCVLFERFKKVKKKFDKIHMC